MPRKATPQVRRDSLKVEELSIQKPTSSRDWFRIKGMLPNGEKVDTSGGKTVTGAKKKAKDLWDEALRISNGGAEVATATFDDAMDAWLGGAHRTWGEGGGERHADSVEAHLRLHVRPVIGKIQCRKLRPSMFEDVLSKLELGGYKPSTVSSVGAACQAAITWMRRNGYIDRDYNPMDGVKYANRTSQWVPYEDRPSTDAVSALADAMRALGGPRNGLRYWLMVQVAAWGGPRWGETIALDATKIDLKRKVILINKQFIEHAKKKPASKGGLDGLGQPVGGPFKATLPKNGKIREVAFPAWMVPYFEQLIAQVEEEYEELLPSGRRRNPLKLLFCTAEGNIPRRSNFNRSLVTPARVAAEWPFEWLYEVDEEQLKGLNAKERRNEVNKAREFRWTWHCLRHHFCSTAVAAKENGGYGWDIARAAKQAGHTNEVFLATYLQPPSDDADHAAESLADVPEPVFRQLRVVGE